MPPSRYAHYVRDVAFRRRLFGFHRGDVRRHLDLVSGWFSLAGLDELVDRRARQLDDRAEQRLREAEEEASRIVAEARREADDIRRAAQLESGALLAQARRQAERERRGRSRVGRPMGAGPDGR